MLPSQTASDIRPHTLISWPQGIPRALRGQVLADRIRLPKHEIAVNQSWDATVGVTRQVFRLACFPFEEVDNYEIDIKR